MLSMLWIKMSSFIQNKFSYIKSDTFVRLPVLLSHMTAVTVPAWCMYLRHVCGERLDMMLCDLVTPADTPCSAS